MTASAKPRAARLREQGARTLIVVLESGHAGVQGIVASRLVESFGRPVVVLTPATDPNQLSGSMRSIPDVDAKAVMDRIADHYTEAVFIEAAKFHYFSPYSQAAC